MTTTHVEVRPGAYADSVTLLRVSRTAQQLDGVVAAQVAMATPLNVDVLTGMGFTVPAGTGANDLVVALHLTGDDALPAAVAGVDRALAEAGRTAPDGGGAGAVAPPRWTGHRARSCSSRCPGRTPPSRRWTPSTPAATS